MSRQRFLIVSLGSIGRRHLGNLRALRPQSEIGVLRLRNTGLEIPDGASFVFADIGEALAFQPDAAIICSPATTHMSVALQLAEAGVHLLIEKPLAIAPREVDPLSKLIEAKGLVASVAYNLRFSPALQAVKSELDASSLGNIVSVRASVGQYLPDWRLGSDYRQSVSARTALGGGALLELSHELDYLIWMFGKPSHVFASGGNSGVLEIDVEDLIEMVWKYPCGKPLVSVYMDMLDRATSRSLRICGTEGTLLWDSTSSKAAKFCASARTWIDLNTEQHQRNDTYVEELTHFLRCIELGQMPESSVCSGRDVLLVVEAARTSLLAGAWAQVN